MATKPQAQPDQLIQLGRHRLLCGDVTDPEQVARLMDGLQAQLVGADPPCAMAKERDGAANDNVWRGAGYVLNKLVLHHPQVRFTLMRDHSSPPIRSRMASHALYAFLNGSGDGRRRTSQCPLNLEDASPWSSLTRW